MSFILDVWMATLHNAWTIVPATVMIAPFIICSMSTTTPRLGDGEYPFLEMEQDVLFLINENTLFRRKKRTAIKAAANRIMAITQKSEPTFNDLSQASSLNVNFKQFDAGPIINKKMDDLMFNFSRDVYPTLQ